MGNRGKFWQLQRFCLAFFLLMGTGRAAAVSPVLQEDSQEPVQDRQPRAQMLFGQAEELAKDPSRHLEAVKKYQEAGRLWLELGDRRRSAEILGKLSELHYLLGKMPQSRSCLEQALPLWETLGDETQLARTLFGLGAVLAAMGEGEQGAEYSLRALPLVQKLGDLKTEGTILNNLGNIRQNLGDGHQALEYYQRALQVREKAGDERGLAITLNNLATVYHDFGEHRQALLYYLRALPLRRATGHRTGEAATLNNIGMTYKVLGEYEQARDYFEQAVEVVRSTGDRRSEGAILNNLASVYVELKEYERAREILLQVLPLRRSRGDRQGEGFSLQTLGIVHRELGETQEALDWLQQALGIFRDVKNPWGEAGTLRQIGLAYLATGRQEEAAEHFHQALQLGRKIYDRELEADMLYQLASVQQSRGNLSEALELIRQAVDKVESLRVAAPSQRSRVSFFSLKQAYYRLAVDLLMQAHWRDPSRNHHREALAFSERARARAFLDSLLESGPGWSAQLDPKLLARESEIRQKLNERETFRLRLLKQDSDPKELEIVAEQIRQLLAEYEQVELLIRAASPQTADLLASQPASVREIQQEALDPETTLLEYLLGEKRSYLWKVTAEAVEAFPLAGRKEIEDAARTAYQSLSSGARAGDDRLDQALFQLRELILQPAGPIHTRRLLIVADGALRYIPFAVLPVHPPSRQERALSAPLALHHQLVVLPSASSLARLRQGWRARGEPDKGIAVLADPVFDPKDVRLTLSRGEMHGAGEALRGEENLDLQRAARDLGLVQFDRLPGTRREAEAILALAGDGDHLRALDFSANLETATDPLLGRYRILHFATHAVLNNHHPELSGIVLSLVNREGEARNGFLRLHDIYRLNLRADLVVLSGCQTALGKEIQGEGIIGLTRGFLHAGASRVVTSLWQVSDRATAELMQRFYRGILVEELEPVEALRQAQLSMWRQRRWQAPYYWAAFVFQGDWL